MLKKLQFAVLVLLIFTSANAQNFKWAVSGGGATYDEGVGITTDVNGNVLITGMLESVANFSGTVLTAAGQHDIVVAKYTADGTLLWVRKAGGLEGDKAYGIVTDAASNVYISGEYEATSSFGNGISITSSGGNDAFIAKYDSSGNIQWVSPIKGAGEERGYGLSLDQTGNIYCTGFSSSGTTNFGNNKTTTGNAGGEDIYLAKFNSSGLCQWAKRFGGSNADRGYQVLADNNGNLFINGVFSNTVNFGTGNQTSAGKTDIYFAKASQSNGTVSWVKKYGSTEDEVVYSLFKDAAGNFYQSGSFKLTTNFGGISLTSSWNSDGFVLKTDNNGNSIWAIKMGSGYADIARGVSADNNGNVFVCGEFGGWVNFGGTNIQSAGDMDAFVACYDATTAAIKWVKGAGSVVYDKARGITTSAAGITYVTGDFKNTVAFGPSTLTSNGLADIFIARMGAAFAAEPTNSSTSLTIGTTTCSGAQLNWVIGNGANRIVIAKAGSAVTALPVDGMVYSANATFGSGADLGGGNFVVYDGTSNTTNITGLSPGVTYHFTVVEYNGAAETVNYKTTALPIANTTIAGANVTFNVQNPSICPGGNVSITASGATTYSWSPSTGLNATTGSTVIANPTTTTTYTVVGTTGACTDTETITVTVGSGAAAVTFNVQNPTICQGGNISITASGATNYTWSPATGLSTTTGSTVVANPTTTTTYTVVGTTGSCSDTKTITVTVASPLVTFSVQNPSICPGGSIDITASGATTYAWSPSTGLSATTGSTVTANPTVTTTYTVVGTTGSCSDTKTITVTVGAGSANVTFSVQNPTICQGGNISITASGATTYSWSPSTGLNTTTGSTVIASPASTTTYTVVGTSGSCSDTETITVTVGSSQSVSFTGLAQAYAPNGSGAFLTGTPAGGVFSGPGMTGNYFSPSVAGTGGPYTITYSVTAGSCVSTATQQTSVTSQPNNCAVPPTSGSASNITSTSALITWSTTAIADSIQLKYRVSGSPEGSSIVVIIPTPAGSPNSYQLTGLTPGTIYSVYLRSICNNVKSANQLRIPFTTPSVARQRNDETISSLENIDFTVYPNPGQGIFNLSFYPTHDQNFKIRIFDMNGRVVWMNDYNAGEGENNILVDLQQYSKGIYIVEMISGSNVYQERMIVQE